MKKIVSILLCAMMLVSSVSAATSSDGRTILVSENFDTGLGEIAPISDRAIKSAVEGGKLKIAYNTGTSSTDYKDYIYFPATSNDLIKLSVDVKVEGFDEDLLTEAGANLFAFIPRADKSYGGTSQVLGGMWVNGKIVDGEAVYTVNNIEIGDITNEELTFEFYYDLANKKRRQKVGDTWVSAWNDLPYTDGKIDGLGHILMECYLIDPSNSLGNNNAYITFDNFEITSNVTDFLEPNSIISPAEGAVVTGTSMELSAYIPDATDVEFILNGNVVANVAESNGIYSVTTEVANTGLNKFEVVYKNATGKHSVSRAFSTSAPMKYNYYGYAMAGATAATTIANNADIVTNAYNGGYRATDMAYKGRVCLEATVTLSSATAHYWLGVGTNTSGYGSTITGWTPLIGNGLRDYYQSDSVTGTGSIFAAGKIGQAGTDGNGVVLYDGKVAYEANVPFVAKIVFDLPNDTMEVYKDGVLAWKSTFKAADGNDPSNIFSKLKLGASKSGAPTMTLENTKLYNETVAPTIASMGGTKVGGSYVINETADSIAVTFDTAYASVAKADVAIAKADGTAVTFADVAYDANEKTATITGISGIKAGDILNVSVLGTAKANVAYGSYTNTDADAITDGARTVYPIKDATGAFATGTAVNATVYVADANGLFKYDADVTVAGASSDVEIKYINAGSAVPAGNDTIFFADYTAVGDSQKLASVKSAPLTFATGDGFFNAHADFAADKVMLWNKATFAPLADLLN